MARILLLVALLVPAEGFAAQKIVLFPIVPVPSEVEPGPANEMTVAILEELKQNKEWSVVQADPPSSAAAAPDSGRRPAKSDAAYRSALADLQEGAKQAQKLRFPQAITKLDKGIKGLVDNLDLLDDYNRLIDAYLLLSVSYFRKGKESAGTDVLEQVARLRPEVELDPSQYPPIFLSIFEQARERALSRRRGSVRITSAPAGAEVVMNGRNVGKTPLLVTSVIPGPNDVVVRLVDKAWAQRVDIGDGETVDKHADLGGGGSDAPLTMGDAMAANRFDREVKKTARNVARSLGGDWAVVLVMGKGTGVYAVGGFLGNARTGKWAALDPIAPDLDMLSASIEAHTLVRDVSEHIKSFSPSAEADDMPFIAGKSVQAPKRGPGLRESTVELVSPRLGGGRRVVSSAAEPPPPPSAARRPIGGSGGAPRSLDLEDTDGGTDSGRAPIAARPPDPPPPAKEPPPQKEEVALVPPPRPEEPEPDVPSTKRGGGPRAPLTRASAGPRGPVVGKASGIEIVDEDEPAPSSREERRADDVPPAAIAAVVVEDGASGPLAVREVESADGGDSLFGKWWFWTAVGGGAAVAALGTWLLFFRDSPPDTVQVYAVW